MLRIEVQPQLYMFLSVLIFVSILSGVALALILPLLVLAASSSYSQCGNGAITKGLYRRRIQLR
jgi:hypothetical protein